MTTIEILGCNATAPARTGAASGYLVRDGDGAVLVDAGPGSLLSFSRTHELSELTGIVVTHMHADHSLDLMAWAYRWTFPDVLPRIPLYLPAEELDRLRRFDELFGIPSLPTMVSPIHTAFEVRGLDLDGRVPVGLGGWTVTPHRASHSVPSAALRFAGPTGIVAFSSDTGPCAAVVDAATDADVFVCESTVITGDEEMIHGHGHLTAELAAVTATRAGARHLVLTHFARPEEAEEMGAIAARHFDGPVTVAREGLVVRGATPA